MLRLGQEVGGNDGRISGLISKDEDLGRQGAGMTTDAGWSALGRMRCAVRVQALADGDSHAKVRTRWVERTVTSSGITHGPWLVKDWRVK